MWVKRTWALATSVASIAFIGVGLPALQAAPAAAADPVTCDGAVATIVGTPGDDVIRAGNGLNIINGLGGNDTIIGGGDDDLICGGDGNDTINGNGSVDFIS